MFQIKRKDGYADLCTEEGCVVHIRQVQDNCSTQMGCGGRGNRGTRKPWETQTSID
jgi:hypothetical protein